MNEETIFHLASQKAGAERTAFLDQTCEGNVDLRRRVEALLEAHEDPRGFMQSPAVSVGELASAHAEGPGTQVGRYKLLQQIGEGGMGIVYMAEQTEPVQRKVALKIIKVGMDSRQVIGRFEAERQALALMDHPNIARVLDAGTTESGRPFFVMELVKGIPITDYCDKHRASPKERLELFIAVCQAVQHAHQKGIIHRDLKPSNVLVAQYDGKPLPKVIDFGVAKATGPKLTDRTLFTEFGAIVGTVEYMSPEEAGLDQLDIDTRSDIYSLGVLLYELLTGTTPLERKRIKEAALLELLRLVREEEPPRPSTRLSRLEQAPTVSANRGLEPAMLTRLIRGELDWIVMKALEKDRARRYETASALAQDVQRHLHDEPVLARPVTGRYRLLKFIRRHRVGTAAGMAVVLALLIGGTVATVSMFRVLKASKAEAQQKIEAENARAEAEAVNRFMVEMFQAADPAESRGERVLARDVLERAARRLDQGSLQSQPKTEAAVRSTLGSTYLELGMYPAAEAQYRKALEIRRKHLGEEHRDVAVSLTALAFLLFKKGDLNGAEALNRQALQMQRKLLGDQNPDGAATLNNLGLVLLDRGDWAGAEPLFRESLLIRRKTFGEEHADVATTLNNLGMLMAYKGDYEKAEQLYRQALDMRRKLLGPIHPLVANSMNSLGLLLCEGEDLKNAEPLLRDALQMRRNLLGEQHVDVATSMNNLGNLLAKRGRDLEEAERLYRSALAIVREQLGEDHPRVPVMLNNLADVLGRKGDLAGAELLLRQALALQRKRLGEHPDVATTLANLAGVLNGRGDLAEAEKLYREALDIWHKSLPENHLNIAITQQNLAAVLRKTGRVAEAESLEKTAEEPRLKQFERRIRAQGWFPPLLSVEQRGPWRHKMQLCVDSIRVSQSRNGQAVSVERVRQPLIRYDQEFRIVQDASIWAWGTRGRPLALLAIEVWKPRNGEATAHFNCVSLADAPFTLERDTPEWRWTPQTPGVKLQELPASPIPQATEAQRLEQMKTLLNRFSAVEVQARDTRVDTRLLPDLYRYSDPASGLLDGALFFIALRTAPEIVVLLEAHREGESLKWYYGLARITEIGLSVSLDGKEIWTAASVRRPPPDEPYWRAPGEPFNAETLTGKGPTTKAEVK
jgi:serine/threonine protein kinase/tetratricopeptide (TPR) repeat protein